jgi:hypothetical protein
MKIVKNCWNLIETYSCQYGSHIFHEDTAKIYVNHWLDVDESLRDSFSRKNIDGFVGHCLLVFRGVKLFNFEVRTCHARDSGKIWSEPIAFNYSGSPGGATTEFIFEGSLQGFPSSVIVRIEAENFELHILDKDEPAKEG